MSIYDTDMQYEALKALQEARTSNWSYIFEGQTDVITDVNIPEGEFDAFIIYKGNGLFQNGNVTLDSKFGDGDITISQGYGWSWYSDLSGYIENFQGSGYYRSSEGSEITQGLTIRNSTFEMNGPKTTENIDMPNEAKDFINKLRKL
jgi:hypothetical protein